MKKPLNEGLSSLLNHTPFVIRRRPGAGPVSEAILLSTERTAREFLDQFAVRGPRARTVGRCAGVSKKASFYQEDRQTSSKPESSPHMPASFWQTLKRPAPAVSTVGCKSCQASSAPKKRVSAWTRASRTAPSKSLGVWQGLDCALAANHGIRFSKGCPMQMSVRLMTYSGHWGEHAKLRDKPKIT
ncbi:uncharacterized protein PV09_04400 [Verruconis gallopava]|uniref:Uncharacterized protein n=1 Tax=Verruconis gallopava TaxID=253628 RepID=A0A0D1XQ13_9PEZI|nr:uncharacterized protein PV09_04400 [Verruconis gallopava]KIW04661.1 hypothetical protein PV09_04400 [Verruconis gallopava]